MLGGGGEVQRGLPPQLAREAALAERERDRQRAAIEAVRLVEELVALVGVAERGRHQREAMDQARGRRRRLVLGQRRQGVAEVLGGGVGAAGGGEQIGEREVGLDVVRAASARIARSRRSAPGEVAGARLGAWRRSTTSADARTSASSRWSCVVVGGERGRVLERPHRARGDRRPRAAGGPRRRRTSARSAAPGIAAA